MRKRVPLKAANSSCCPGVIYTARDAAHKRLCELVEKGEPLPFDVKNATIYYVGPTPAKPGQVIGSAGPTTSYRMDGVFADAYPRGRNGHDRQRQAQCGGHRCNEKIRCGLFCRNRRRRCAAFKLLKKAEIIAYEDLGAEALRRLEVENFPVVAVIDSEGNNLYEKGRREYLETVDANGNA